jgi:hypothetical protein
MGVDVTGDLKVGNYVCNPYACRFDLYMLLGRCTGFRVEVVSSCGNKTVKNNIGYSSKKTKPK